MLRAAISVCACLVSLTVGTAAPLTGAPGPSPSSPNKTSSGGTPVGVFVKLDIETAIQGILANPLPSPGPVNTHPTVPQLHALLRSLYVKLMADPAVSGIIVGEHWDHIEMSSPSYPYVPVDGYDWSYLDDVFAVADQDHMPVQLLITPGLDSPRALLTAIPSCNGLFAKQVKNHQKVEKVKANCGTVVFPSIPEQSHADSRTFPLPWDSTYNQAWQGFLRLLNARYQDNPEFASIAVAGPVGASTEMILPTSAGTHNNRVDGMWATLIQHSFPHNTSYQGSDEVFVDQWDQTIDFYEKVFRGITLVLTPDSGSDLPDFSHSVAQAPGNELYPSDLRGQHQRQEGWNRPVRRPHVLRGEDRSPDLFPRGDRHQRQGHQSGRDDGFEPDHALPSATSASPASSCSRTCRQPRRRRSALEPSLTSQSQATR